ncbi:hypothetical protein OG864_32970 [Streptomyces sp. NBC_00124]|uniref:hypothetical protein n=1 Tax=Streptomyces sp. NBC_00124 TaxID=2975662 RepID=UPI002252E4FC|nr:hypothetical protein [Streptomyces sp. NBC_00124]MCX5363503.1 hypothetical protein [Streptomyces sp. NBC_00124]
MTERPSVSEMMNDFGRHVAAQLRQTPEVIETDGQIDTSDLFIDVAKWRKYPQVSCTFADLAGSTSLRNGRWEASTASIYDAAVKPAVRILSDFGADFIDVQGDAAFGLFTGKYSQRRAICAGITIKAFGERILMPALEKKWPTNTPQTGFKVGCAISDLLSKKIGISRTDHHAPVWAGRAVNYAAKCSQQASAHQMIVTKPIADIIRRNEYLWYSCQCGNDPTPLWSEQHVEKVSGKDSEGLLLTSSWCETCGDSYCDKICSGSWRRPDLDSKRNRLAFDKYQQVIKFRDQNSRQIRRGING